MITLGHRLSSLSRAERAALRRSEVAVIAQDASLVPFLSARENVELGLQVRSAEGNAVETLASVGPGQLAEQRVDRLSMGATARSDRARSSATAPALLLADEPSARLDEANAVAVGDLLARVVEESDDGRLQHSRPGPARGRRRGRGPPRDEREGSGRAGSHRRHARCWRIFRR